MSRPLVSIVIPCYKGEGFLGEAIESCQRQTYAPLEVVVVDDASPDRCAEIAERYARSDDRIRVIRHARNRGVSQAFNTGYNAAGGEYFTRIAQDDVFEEDAIERMVGYLESHPEIGLTYCDYLCVDEGNRVLCIKITPEASGVLRDGNHAGLCVMWRREVWTQTGLFDPEFDTAEDYDYWLRVSDNFALGKCGNAIAMRVRIHTGSGSNVFSVKQEILAAKLLARRTPGRMAAAKVLGAGYFNAAYNAWKKGDLGNAWRCLAIAAWHWPFDFRLVRLAARLGLSALR